jgi:hypothetical protein
MQIDTRTVACAIMIGILLMFTAASLTGHWHSQIPKEMVRPLHEHIESIGH